MAQEVHHIAKIIENTRKEKKLLELNFTHYYVGQIRIFNLKQTKISWIRFQIHHEASHKAQGISLMMYQLHCLAVPMLSDWDCVSVVTLDSVEGRLICSLLMYYY